MRDRKAEGIYGAGFPRLIWTIQSNNIIIRNTNYPWKCRKQIICELWSAKSEDMPHQNSKRRVQRGKRTFVLDLIKIEPFFFFDLEGDGELISNKNVNKHPSHTSWSLSWPQGLLLFLRPQHPFLSLFPLSALRWIGSVSSKCLASWDKLKLSSMRSALMWQRGQEAGGDQKHKRALRGVQKGSTLSIFVLNKGPLVPRVCVSFVFPPGWTNFDGSIQIIIISYLGQLILFI